jgi:RNA polymerase sigma-70 factor, ECF subfamily
VVLLTVATSHAPKDGCFKGPSEPAQWVTVHGDALFRFAMSRLRDQELAENAVQETFLAALKARDAFSGAATERSWLIGILKRKVIDHFRHQARQEPTEDIEAVQDQVGELFDERGRWRTPPGRWRASPEELAERDDFRRVLTACLGDLPERQARAFTLCEVEERDGPEACEVLAVSTSNLYVLLHRARSRLRRCLELSWFEQGEG